MTAFRTTRFLPGEHVIAVFGDSVSPESGSSIIGTWIDEIRAFTTANIRIVQDHTYKCSPAGNGDLGERK